MWTDKAKEVLKIEAEAVLAVGDRLDSSFDEAVEAIHSCSGRVVVTGMGKAGIIGQKISATLSSLGIPSLWLHPAEAIHGDLGRVTKNDIVLSLSNSGETEEILKLLPAVKRIGAGVISLCGKPGSKLARESDITIDISVKREACSLGIAPTASTTAMLAAGDALSICVAQKRGLREEDYALLHPGGALGRKLMKVEELMRKGADHPIVDKNTTVREVLMKITEARAGCACVVDERGVLSGIFTDGDLRRSLEKDEKILSKAVSEVMTKGPKVTIRKGQFVSEAASIITRMQIDEVPVVDEEGRPVGIIDEKDFLDIKE